MTTSRLPTNYYDAKIVDTYITSRNFDSYITPRDAHANLFPCDQLDRYYFDTLLYLHLFSSLYIALENFQKTENYSITSFTKLLENLNIEITNTTIEASVPTNIGSIINVSKTDNVITSGVFKFDLASLRKYPLQTTDITNQNGYTYSAGKIQTGVLSNKLIPITYGLATFNETTGNASISPYVNIDNAGYTAYTSSAQMNSVVSSTSKIVRTFKLSDFTAAQSPLMTEINATRTTIYDNDSRTQKLYSIIYNILLQTPQNIMGYLLFNKLYCNIILCNLSIQIKIRSEYINKFFSNNTQQLYGDGQNFRWLLTDTGANVANTDSSVNGKDKINIAGINTQIINVVSALQQLSNNHFPSIDNRNENTAQEGNTRYYLQNKNNYKDKIDYYKGIYERYLIAQDRLNNIVATYNQYIKDFSKMKTYGNIVIIFLIVMTIFIIALSILPIMNANNKQAFYIIVLIALIVVTYLFYDNFKYVNIVEKFTSNANLVNTTAEYVCTPHNKFNGNRRQAIVNNSEFYRVLAPSIDLYTGEINKLLNKIRANIYITGARTFSQNTEDIMIDIQRDKLAKISIYDTKKTNLLNMIEVMKKQLSYTFNLILLFCIFLIILLFALLLYSSIPDAFPFIIGISILLIIVFLTYFIIAIVQPTRMKATNNYWANFHPSTKTLNSL